MTITRTENYFRIAFAYKPYLIDRVKELPDRRFDSTNKAWIVPVRHEVAVKAFAEKNHFSFTVDQEEENYSALPPMPQLTQAINLKMKLFPYQETGVAYGLEKRKLIIGDQMGLGKTAQAISIVTGANAFPCLIICPSSLKINWQREFGLWTNYKCLILNDQTKRNFHLYWSSGLAQVFIVNYESLKKYFVESINTPKGAKLRLDHIKFKKTATEMFRSVIIDESHRCFPYETKILTNKGLIPIGEIVENNMINLTVASVNLSNFSVSLNKIKTFWKNELGQRSIYKIKHDKGELKATEDHEIYTSAGRYKKVSEIKSGDYLYLLRSEFLDGESWAYNSKVLLKKLCVENGKCKARNKGITKITAINSEARENLPNLRTTVFNPKKYAKQVLRAKLFRKMENVATGCVGWGKNSGVQGESKIKDYTSNAECRNEKNALSENEGKQSYEKPRNIGKNDKKYAGQNISFARRQWSVNGTSKTTLEQTEFTRIRNGISNKNQCGETSIQVGPVMLQSRYWHREYKTGNRSGRIYSRNKKMEVSGQTENGNIEFVRVESCEIYQPASEYRNEPGFTGTQKVYDLEISENHNYFADGILVSNCKSSSTQQSKFAKGICAGKDYILALTGTPVINKPKDLISQLSIIEKLNVFGGYQKFVQRYCSGANEASNLRELNYNLNLHCFYRRDKQDVLKDLPDKTRTVALCEISTRKEYQDAERDLIEYLIKYKEADDQQIARSMRGEIMVRIGILKNISARGKLKDVFEFVDDLMESGEKLVLFGHLHEVLNAIKAHYPNAVSVTGMDDMNSRQHSVDKFQNDPETKLIVCSTKAAGVGLTLTASSRVVFVELPWTAADCDQAEDRCHRIGQKDNVTCTYFLGQNTIDEKIYEIIQTKRDIASTVTGATEQVEEDVINLVIDLFNQKKSN